MSDESTWKPRDTNKQVSLTGSVDEVIAQCEQLNLSDKSAERRRPLIIVLTVLASLVVFIAAFGQREIWMLFAAGAVLIGGIVFAIRVSRQDIDDRKIELVQTVVTTFREELRSGRPVQASIDFRAYWHMTPNDAWATVSMTLQNGVTAQLTARTKNKRKTKQKRKYVKIKDKMVEQWVVRLSPPKGESLDPGLRVPRIDGRVGSLSLHQAKVAPRAATFVFCTEPVLRVSTGWPHPPSDASQLLQGRDAVLALITSYHLLGRAAGQAAAAG